MAFGRSNSLSLNTSAVNNSFAAQQSQQPSQPSNSLFGGSLFGNSQGAKPATSTTGSSLFGAQPSQNTTTTGGGLFGNNNNNSSSSSGNNPQPSSTSLFGQQQQQQPASTSLFGQQPQAQQQAASNTSLFGGSLFGQGSNQTAKPNTSLFGSSTANAAPTINIAQPSPMQASLLGASRYSSGQPAPYTGRLSMGQGNAAQASTTPAAKLSWDNVRLTTRFDDLVDTAKEQLELVDKMVQQQEIFAKQIEAFLPVHSSNLESLSPDIDLIKDKVDIVEQTLVADAQGVQVNKQLAEKDHQDVLRCERIGENLRLPAQYQYAPASAKYSTRKTNGTNGISSGDYDTDLVGHYFVPMTAEMKKVLDAYQSNLSEIESHLQTIESSAIAQARSISQQRTGSAANNDAHLQLTETLRDMEETILSTATKVGACRDSVTELSLRRASSNSRRG